ncbi:MAG: alanine--glyoxylate aminotransferase family protein [Actinomycetota bacterium]|nr:alanine--glyoxylate aminotransferase family protein [Actinomycetota bacterium]MDD5665909.1 alanine--glyoxylate aminotransferase family protein [Actinomycetota bacterium]
MIRKEYLMTPGPTPIPHQVSLVQAEPIIHHRTPAYTELFVRMVEGLKKVLLTKNDVLTFAASGTGAMEGAVANCFSPGDRVLVAAGGKFGQRFAEIGRVYGLEVEEYEYPWDEAADAEVIARYLREKPDTRGVFVTHSETSTGVVNDVKAIGEAVRGTGAILVVDSISGAGALELRTDEWSVDVLVTGSQKALMTPPGLAAVAVSPKAWELVDAATLPAYYFCFKKARKKFNSDSPESPFTPPVSLVKGMSVAMDILLEEGMEEAWERHRVLAMCTRAAVRAMGLELFPKDLDRAYAVTAVKAPGGIGGGDIVRHMNRVHGVIIAGGQDRLKGRVFRIGHVGYYGFLDVVAALSALEMTLAELGHSFDMGSGIAAAEKVYLEMTHSPS